MKDITKMQDQKSIMNLNSKAFVWSLEPKLKKQKTKCLNINKCRYKIRRKAKIERCLKQHAPTFKLVDFLGFTPQHLNECFYNFEN
jgi:hypothetical protein